MGLIEAVQTFGRRGECQCGLCADKGDAPDPNHAADVQFFKVAVVDGLSADVLKALITRHRGEFCEVELFDGKEHGYQEIGGWLGNQQLALMLMGMGALLGLWELLTPARLMPGIPADLQMQMAQAGMVTIKTVTRETAKAQAQALVPGLAAIDP